MQPLKTIVVPGYQGRGMEVARGNRIRITDMEGCQIGDLFLLNRDDPAEVFSPSHTRLVNFTPFPRVGDSFFSNRRRAMATFLKDATPGAHDMTFAPCDPEFYIALGGARGHPNCRRNFELAMQAIRRNILIYPDPVNVFQNTPVGADGNYILGRTLTRPGDHIELRAEMDLVVVLTACSADLPIAGVDPIDGKSTPLRVDLYCK